MPQVTCPNCAKGVEITEEQLGGQHTCEVCGTGFNLSLQPAGAGAPANVTMTMGKAFNAKRDPGAPSEEGDFSKFVPFAFLAVVLVLGLMAYILL